MFLPLCPSLALLQFLPTFISRSVFHFLVGGMADVQVEAEPSRNGQPENPRLKFEAKGKGNISRDTVYARGWW